MTETFQMLLYAEDGTLLADAPMHREDGRLVAQDVAPLASGVFHRAVIINRQEVELHLSDRCLGPHVRLDLSLDTVPLTPERFT